MDLDTRAEWKRRVPMFRFMGRLFGTDTCLKGLAKKLGEVASIERLKR